MSEMSDFLLKTKQDEILEKISLSKEIYLKFAQLWETSREKNIRFLDYSREKIEDSHSNELDELRIKLCRLRGE